MIQPELAHLDCPDGKRLAYRLRPGGSPTILFLPGYASDMEGAKAVALDGFAARRGLAILRFDYSGTGASAGKFEEGTLAAWLDETLLMIDRLTQGPLVLVGSSMGGWLALLAAQRRRQRVMAVVGVAAAPDFTDWGFTDQEKSALRENGRLERPNPYGAEPQLTTRAFWESGESLRLLDEPIALDCPIRLVHGDADKDVPIAIAVRTMDRLRSADVQLLAIKAGKHRLSEPHEIDAIVHSLAALTEPME